MAQTSAVVLLIALGCRMCRGRPTATGSGSEPPPPPRHPHRRPATPPPPPRPRGEAGASPSRRAGATPARCSTTRADRRSTCGRSSSPTGQVLRRLRDGTAAGADRSGTRCLRDVDPSLLGTTRRVDGALQVTYRRPSALHYAHEGPNEVKCHNVATHGGLWWVVTPSGAPPTESGCGSAVFSLEALLCQHDLSRTTLSPEVPVAACEPARGGDAQRRADVGADGHQLVLPQRQDARQLGVWPRLGKVFYDLSIDEMRDADELISRILLFDGHPNVQR